MESEKIVPRAGSPMNEHERISELEGLTFHLQQISESEKTRLGRELHDALGSLLTAIKMDVAWVRGRLSADQNVLIDKLERTMRNLDQVIHKKRQIIEELRPTTLSSFGLVTAARELAEQAADQAGWELRMEVAEEDPNLPDDAAITLYRCLQEALSNAAKHAKATRVRITLACAPHACKLEIEDNGVGFCERDARPNAYGLLGMRQRLAGRGGTLKISSEAGRG
ncbi:MAG TPA: sensor histidine kinase, partial [Burkholderiales bacterium]|nr:sensor histidine kinase [Burkholderiales bacterium]